MDESWHGPRRFGVEIEINALDERACPASGTMPNGIFKVAEAVRKATGAAVIVHKVGHDHHNADWVVKPDGSCGIEIASPVSKGEYGLKTISAVMAALKALGARADERCSTHVHVDVTDLSDGELENVLAWWVATEPVWIDSVPGCRKRNRYCTTPAEDLLPGRHDLDELLRRLGTKYYSANAFHLKNFRRRTVEFRLFEACLDGGPASQWVRLLLRFVERAKLSHPGAGGWLGPKDLFALLGFHGPLTAKDRLLRDWFVDRLVRHSAWEMSGVFGRDGRYRAREEYLALRRTFADETVNTPEWSL